MRISDWSSDVCSSDLLRSLGLAFDHVVASPAARVGDTIDQLAIGYGRTFAPDWDRRLYLASPATLLDVIHGFPREAERRSEEHTSELQSLIRISYAVFCLKKKKQEIIKKNRLQQT